MTDPPAAKTKIRIAAILITTITLFALALSFTPRTRIHVSARMTSNAGTLKKLPVNWPPAIIGSDKLLRQMERRTAHPRMSLKYAENPTATAMFETAYSRIRSQPMIQAKISPSVA